METLEDDDEDITVRRRCLESVAPFNTEAIQNFVEWAYSSEDEDLKSSSIYAMGRTGEAAWLPILISELQSPEPTVRYETAHACGELGEDDAVLHLIELLRDEDYQVQLAGIAALGKIGGPLAKRALLKLCERRRRRLGGRRQGRAGECRILGRPVGVLIGLLIRRRLAG